MVPTYLVLGVVLAVLVHPHLALLAAGVILGSALFGTLATLVDGVGFLQSLLVGLVNFAAGGMVGWGLRYWFTRGQPEESRAKR